MVIFQGVIEEKRDDFDEDTFNSIFSKETKVSRVIEETIKEFDNLGGDLDIGEAI